ncbi:hypothetical protein RJ640_025163, partial [Escallonia rubra]
MASLSLNSLSVQPPSHPRKLVDTLSSTHSGSLKPIVVCGNPPTFVSAPGRRIVAVGDLHGDLAKARCALELAGVLSSDGQDSWVGGETVLVQLGDILDRGADEIAILSLLKSLDVQAKATGGAVFQVNGNHETMNIEGDFRYVDYGAYDECTDFLQYLDDCDHNWEEAFVGWVGVSERWKEDRKLSERYWDPWDLVKRQKGVIARSILLRPGGPLASELARHAVVLKVDDWVFCHGGLLPHHGKNMLPFANVSLSIISFDLFQDFYCDTTHTVAGYAAVAYGMEKMNREVSNWMRGLSGSDDSPEIPFIAIRGYDSVVWSRLYSRDTAGLEDYQVDQIQSILEETLQAVDAKAMVVGHTPQTTGVNCKYNCSIWRIDVGMSSGVLNSRPE